MNNKRTGGMTTMGILNIVFGAFGTLGSLLIILGGGILAASSGAIESGSEIEGMGEMAAAGGGLFMLIGFVSAVFSVMLIFAGIGVLKLKPWGRKLSMVCGGGFIFLNLFSLFGSGFTLSTIIGIAYGGTLLVLCFTESWKKAFAPSAKTDDTFPSAASASAPSFAAIPEADSAPEMPSQSSPPAHASSSGGSKEPASTGLPGMPSPSKKNQDDDDVASAA